MSDSIHPKLREFIDELTTHFKNEPPSEVHDAIVERLARIEDDEEAVRVGHGVVHILAESKAIIQASLDFLSTDTIHLYSESVGASEDRRCAAAIRGLQ